MNELQVFNNPEFGTVRTIEEEGKILFCGFDVAKALGYANKPKALNDNCRYITKRSAPHPQSPNKTIEMLFIPEGDVYRLIARSRLPAAERFESWVFDEVLPTIRATGGYIRKTMSAAEQLAAQANLLVEMEQRQRQLEQRVNNALKALARPQTDDWVSRMKAEIDSYCELTGLYYPKARGLLYEQLERECRCDTNARLRKLRERHRKAGKTYKAAMELTKLDAIAESETLRVAFEGVVAKAKAAAALDKN